MIIDKKREGCLPRIEFFVRIKSLFLLCAAAIALIVTLLFARVTFYEFQIYQDSKSSEQCVTLVSAALTLMEKISLERAPTNGLLGEPAANQQDRRSTLSQAREKSDLAISRLQGLLLHVSRQHRDTISRYLAATIRQLQNARKQVDALADRPLADRSPDAIRAAVKQMIRIVGEIRPAATYISVETPQRNPALSSALTSAYLAAELREFAGQLGSQVTAALARKQSLSDAELRDIDHLIGRIEVLYELLRLRAGQFLQTPEVERQLEQIGNIYFRDGMQLIQNTIDRCRIQDYYTETPYEFAGKYVPTMAPILGMRDIALQQAASQVAERRSAAERILFQATAGYIFLLLILAVMMIYLNRQVIQPIETTIQVIVSIAAGKSDTDVPTTDRRDEIGDILRSIQILKEETVRRKQAEEAREELLGRLQKALANVKTLSGLLPICAHCKKVRDDKGYWNQIEVYVRQHSEAQFSHSICPQCMQELYPEFCDKIDHPPE